MVYIFYSTRKGNYLMFLFKHEFFYSLTNIFQCIHGQKKLVLVKSKSMFFVTSVKALNEIRASLGWRVVYAWVGDDPCGDGNLPPWSGVTCTTQGDFSVVTEL